MPNLFGLDLAGIVNGAIESAGGVLPATLTKLRNGTRIPGDVAGGRSYDQTDYAARGFMAKGSRTPPGDLGSSTTATIVLLGASIEGGAVPEASDRVTIEGETWDVVSVARDPAAATYTLAVRGV